MMKKTTLFLMLFTLLSSLSLYAIDFSKIPPPLQEWKEWVLDDVADRDCPVSYQTGKAECTWFKNIALSLSGNSLEFTMSVVLYREKTKVSLPSAHLAWAESVMVDGQKAVVLDSHSKAIVTLGSGSHTISGAIPWREGLKYVQLPGSAALVTLHKNNQLIPNISPDKNSRLWLDKRESTKREKGSLSVSIYRKIIDGHPLRMQSYLHLSVSGKMRSTVLDGVVLDGFLPTMIESPLEATVTEENKLKVELKAGEWKIIVNSYTPQNLSMLQKPMYKFPYANQEIWSLQSSPDYRSIEIEGVQTIDSSQTTLPQEWRALPSYLISDKAFTIKELYKSAQQQQKNRFVLQRKAWLDFDGGGYTIHDAIVAKISEPKRLEATKDLELASVTLNTKPTLITTLGDSPQKGVALRTENLKIGASGRFTGDISRLPVSGWDEKFDAINTTLHLPPGWQLFASFGSDGRTFSWVDKWNLMDIFLLMLLGIVIYRLYGWQWALPATFSLILLWQESGAPAMVWLFLLATVALLRVLDEGKLRIFIHYLMVTVSVFALLQIISFTIYEIRTILYPQLEKEHFSILSSPAFMVILSVLLFVYAIVRLYKSFSKKIVKTTLAAVGLIALLMLLFAISIPKLAATRDVARAAMEGRIAPSSVGSAYSTSLEERKNVPKRLGRMKSQIMQNRVDPNAVVQAGVAKPSWYWNSYRFSWQGTVGGNEKLELWLLSPSMSKTLKVLRIIAMFFLFTMFVGSFLKPLISRGKGKGVQSVALLLMLMLSPQTIRADIPSDAMLGKLRDKLTLAPTCLPHCASIGSMEANIVGDMLTIGMSVSAGTDIALPIFGNRNIWLPSTVTIDGEMADLHTDESGKLWLMATEGVHDIRLSGSLSSHNQIILSSGMPLHNLKNLSTSTAWQLSSDGKSYIEINNLKEREEKEKERSKVSPMVEVKRTFYLGQRWYVDTVVVLKNRIERPHTLLYPLLPNESMLNKEIGVKNGKAMLHLSSKKSHYRWRSTLPITSDLKLNFPKSSRHTEVWQMDVSAIWNVDYSGLEPVKQSMVGTVLMPIFKPWRGEKLSLKIEKSKAVSGDSLSIESSRLEITQSQNYRDLVLSLKLKSSKAGQYRITLDGITELKPTKVDGTSHYLKIRDNIVSIPLKAKTQKVKLSWREKKKSSTNYSFPHIDLGKKSANSDIELMLPYKRWIVWTDGPVLGPAVLLWGALLAVVLFAFIAGRFKNLPLKTRDWIVLGLGIGTTSMLSMLPIVLWILAFRFKEVKGSTLERWPRNLTQIGLVVLTLIALGTIVFAVSAGLLGNPDMMIAGNGSYGNHLSWYSDRISSAIVEPTVISMSIWYYRVLMLLWAVWLAFSMVRWLKWAWIVFTQGDMWVGKEK